MEEEINEKDLTFPVDGAITLANGYTFNLNPEIHKNVYAVKNIKDDIFLVFKDESGNLSLDSVPLLNIGLDFNDMEDLDNWEKVENPKENVIII